MSLAQLSDSAADYGQAVNRRILNFCLLKNEP